MKKLVRKMLLWNYLVVGEDDVVVEEDGEEVGEEDVAVELLGSW